MAGFFLVILYLLVSNHSWQGSIGELTVDSGRGEDYFSILGVGADGALRYVAILAPSFIISPGLLQKVFGARDENAVRRGVGLNALGLLLFAIIPAILGIMAYEKFPDLENSELALPVLLTRMLPFWLGALLLAAIFSAELSAADAALFMLSTALSRDLYQSFVDPKVENRRLMIIARISAVACGLIGGLLAILLETVISALTIFYTLLTAALFLPLIAGLYTRRVSAGAASGTMIASVVITFALDRMTGGVGQWGIPSLIWGMLGGMIVMIILTFTRR
jgi:SSS family solute:Na+ symporter